MSRLSEDLRRLADGFEAAALPAETVVARIGARQQTRRAMIPAIAAAAAVVALVLGVTLRDLLTAPNVGPPVMPSTTGLFRTLEPDGTGRCFAVRLYETTAADGRAALWAWTGTDGCAARTSNLFAGTGTATAFALPAGADGPARSGIEIVAATGATGSLRGLEFVLDPLASGTGTNVTGFRSRGEIAGAHTLELLRIDALEVPYRVN